MGAGGTGHRTGCDRSIVCWWLIGVFGVLAVASAYAVKVLFARIAVLIVSGMVGKENELYGDEEDGGER